MARKYSYPEVRYPHRQTQPETRTLGRVGLGVFRSVHNPASLTDAVMLLEGMTNTPRGYGGQKPMAVNLVEIPEVRRQPGVAGVTNREAQAIIFDSLPFLRRKLTAGIAGVEIFGRHSSPSRSLVLLLDEATTQTINDERLSILQTLESIGAAGYPYKWLAEKTPHITIAQLPRASHGTLSADLASELMSAMPETVQLRRPVFYPQAN